ncbi:MAG: HupE/UreJ family protein [Methylovulum sp.]|jgi:urease accessory protein|nr:HupE/UreJ family protein [Methylovulum sp.]MCF7997760.1 HupE/UreJ family protein [Methylovulum sp.]
MKMKMLLSLLVFAVMTNVEAHPLHMADAGLAAGLAHPFIGLDHLLAMIAVGIWAGQLGGRATWLVPLSFVSVMGAAALLGSYGQALPLVESGIATSVLILGLLIAGAVRLPIRASIALVGLFAMFHGYAHGLELPLAGSATLYGLGFISATALLHGIGIGFAASTRRYQIAQRLVGFSLIASGGLLLAGI